MIRARNVLLSCEILAAHKLRTLLSMTGIFIGTGAVILMVAAGRGAEKNILDRIRSLGTNLLIVNAGQTRLIAGRERQVKTVTTLLPQDAEAIQRDCGSVARVSAVVSRRSTIRYESETVQTRVEGMTPAGFAVRNIRVSKGGAFGDEENRGRRRVALLGPTVAGHLFGQDDPISAQIRIDRVPFEVVGVTDRKGMDLNGSDQDDRVIVPLETAMRRLLNVSHLNQIYVQGAADDALDRAETEIRTVLRERHRLRARPDDFTILNQLLLLETHRAMARSLTVLIGSVAGISLFVGGVGIMAVMLISVRERTREIGLRRALGARRRDIRAQFLIESAILAGGGGLAGVLAGLAVIRVASRFGGWEMSLSWPAATVAFGFSILIGLAFGIYPALRATRFEPIEALRGE